MGTSVMRWVVMGVSLLVVGPLLAWLARLAPGAESGGIVTPLTSSSLVLGVLAWVVISALAGAWGAFVSHLLSWRMALAASGVALVWAAWGTARLDDLVRTVDGADPAWRMGFDGLLVALPVCLIGAYTMRSARPLGDDDEGADAPALVALALGAFALASLAASWVIARDGHQGQTIVAALVAGIAGGAAARGFASRLRPAWFLLAVPVTLLVAPVVGGLATGANLVEATFDASVSPWLRVMPIDWIAGVLIGLPVGVAQADSVVHKQHPELHAGKPVS